MTDRIIDISKRGMRLKIRNQLLCVEHPDFAQPQTIPVSDVGALVFSTPAASLTQPVVAELSNAGAIIVFCDDKHSPAAMTLPLHNNAVQAERFRLQTEASLPVKKRAWKEIVTCKIRRQADFIQTQGIDNRRLLKLAGQVKSGDSDNCEGQAARVYWKALGLFPKREPGSDTVNGLLDYGYMVLNAVVARAICSSGLHPGLGLHHHNRYNPFCLASDLMEPFRPLVDQAVVEICQTNEDPELSKETKARILSPLFDARPLMANGQRQSLFHSITSLCASLVGVFSEKEDKLDLPKSLG